jgi:multidrug transporter EmrE-like cation transporter
MPIFFAIASIVFGVGSFAFANAAGVPVFGLAFAAAGFLRESRSGKRRYVLALLTAGVALCAYGTFLSLKLNAR